MSLTLYVHPLASFAMKALVAIYETGQRFTSVVVDLGDATSRDAFFRVWPMGKIPVLRDDARGETIPESTIVIEYLAQHYPGGARLMPADPDAARRVRLLDRLFDLYVQESMQKIVLDRIRPADGRDPYGVAQAREALRKTYGIVENMIDASPWAAGAEFTMADCAAAPALFYADKVEPFRDAHGKLAAYFDRLLARPSFARALEEAQPYMQFFPEENR
jgi:glutathione S-transferase